MRSMRESEQSEKTLAAGRRATHQIMQLLGVSSRKDSESRQAAALDIRIESEKPWD